MSESDGVFRERASVWKFRPGTANNETPRIRIQANDPTTALDDAAVLQDLFSLRFSKREARRLAVRLLNRFGSIGAILSASPERLRSELLCDGAAIGVLRVVKCASLALLKEEAYAGPILSDLGTVAKYMHGLLARERVEQIWGVFLNASNRLIGDARIASGTVNHCHLFFREILRYALEFDATSLILVHNHPSGNPTPSRDDILLSEDLRRSAELLDIVLHDSLIIGNGRWVSLRESGLMGEGSKKPIAEQKMMRAREHFFVDMQP